MSTGRSIEKIKQNKENAINAVTTYLNNLFSDNASKSDKLSFWIQDYIKFLCFEERFRPKDLIRYVRGDIIKVNFGFRIGSELGGLHYCVVIDNYNSINANTITVVPLSSLKKVKDLHKLPKDRVYLGTDLSEKVEHKAAMSLVKWGQAIDEAKKLFKDNITDLEEFKKSIKKIESARKNSNKITDEFKKMKHGSIALVGQITTISKMRIHDPKNIHHVLHGVRLSPKNLDLINKKIQELYIHS